MQTQTYNLRLATSLAIRKKRKEKDNYASSKKLLTSIKEKWPLGKKSPFTKAIRLIGLRLVIASQKVHNVCNEIVEFLVPHFRFNFQV